MAKNKKLIQVVVICLLALSLHLPRSADAASLYFSPIKNTYEVGDTFSVSVYVDSSDQPANAVSGVVSFSAENLAVTAVSKANSVVSMWIQDPSFSNVAGTVNFEGVILNSGFTGSNGKIVTITFRAKGAGSTNIGFSSGSVLANDGSGSNILTGMKTMSLVVQPKSDALEVSDIPKAEPLDGKSGGVLITSISHPDPKKWYSNNTPEFSWSLPAGSLEVRTSIGKSANSMPTVRYAPPISYKKVEQLPDGVYYFNLQIRTSNGWGNVSRYQINIDTEPPKPFTITFPHGKDSIEPQPVILFNTTDTGSDISHYDVKIGEGGPLRSAPLALSNPYPLPPQGPGQHMVTVTAVDQAGNTTSTSTEFNIEGIELPVITYYPAELDAGDILKIRGTTYPNSDIYVYTKKDGETISEDYSRSNGLGDFSVVATKRLTKGQYTFTARAIDSRGAKSAETDPLGINVRSTFLNDLTASTLNLLSAVILALLAIGGVVCLMVFLWHRCHRVVRRIRQDRLSANEITAKSFDILHRDIQNHLSLLKDIKRKKLSVKEEIIFLEEFGEDLVKANDIIQRHRQSDSSNL